MHMKLNQLKNLKKLEKRKKTIRYSGRNRSCGFICSSSDCLPGNRRYSELRKYDEPWKSPER